MPHGKLHKKKLSKNATVLAIIFAVVALIWGITMVKIKGAEAADLQSCGEATTYDLDTETPYDFCNIQARQLAYRDEAIKFRKQIAERGENFAAPSREANKAYKEQLESLHDSINESNITSISPHSKP